MAQQKGKGEIRLSEMVRLLSSAQVCHRAESFYSNYYYCLYIHSIFLSSQLAGSRGLSMTNDNEIIIGLPKRAYSLQAPNRASAKEWLAALEAWRRYFSSQ